MFRPIVIVSRVVGNKQYGLNILHMIFPVKYSSSFLQTIEYAIGNQFVKTVSKFFTGMVNIISSWA